MDVNKKLTKKEKIVRDPRYKSYASIQRLKDNVKKAWGDGKLTREQKRKLWEKVLDDEYGKDEKENVFEYKRVGHTGVKNKKT